jgi:flagellar transcriptional activator FlhD
MTATADAAKEIADLNLTYMLLAQKMLRADKPAAMLRLGISPAVAELLSTLPLADVIKLAASNFVLCTFRLDELPGFRSVVEGARQQALQQAHISIILAGAQGGLTVAAPDAARPLPARSRLSTAS